MNEDKKAIELKHRFYYADYIDKNYIEKDKIRELMNKYNYLGDSDFEIELIKLLEE